jgi:hypothetical protein
MKEISILFSGPMVRAILEGSKMQTRRVAMHPVFQTLSYAVDCGDGWYGDEEGQIQVRCPYGQPGDRLWVREAWRVGEGYDELPGSKFTSPEVWYEVDTKTPPPKAGRYRHARFMPRWASRLTLQVADVRVQRLQDISEEDAKAEGAPEICDMCGNSPTHEAHWVCEKDYESQIDVSHKVGFQKIWDSIYAESAPWASNPWVWALTFKVVQ